MSCFHRKRAAPTDINMEASLTKAAVGLHFQECGKTSGTVENGREARKHLKLGELVRDNDRNKKTRGRVTKGPTFVKGIMGTFRKL